MNFFVNVMMMLTLLILNVNCASVLDDTIAPAKRLHWVVLRTLQESSPLRKGFSNELNKRQNSCAGGENCIDGGCCPSGGCATSTHVECPGSDGCCPTIGQCPLPGSQYCTSGSGGGSSPSRNAATRANRVTIGMGVLVIPVNWFSAGNNAPAAVSNTSLVRIHAFHATSYLAFILTVKSAGAPTGCGTPSYVVCPGTDGRCPTASQCPAPGGQYCNSSGSSPPRANTPPNTPAVTPPTVTVTQPVTISNTPVNTPAITTTPSSDSSNGRLTNAAGRTNGFETGVGNLVMLVYTLHPDIGIATALSWLIARKQGDTDSINFSAVDVICKSMNVQNWFSAGNDA
ncbi:hypothetical protein M408DRAFT_10923 [Serendipita vermifera MAFF 305830]|uniref:Granulins domain-containing protein n=1 Tax=Serendipita vermifera MAFF 305830 TaxID=933852 RepID=A0A0C2X5T1_SERVB|nr:hypothetical protein M408DRAFT_10923 [Serendipita vermifera MAFF 305830]